MISNWSNLRPNAIQMRKDGKSLIAIEKNLGIPKSTLSGWLKTIRLTKIQKLQLINNKLEALKQARIKASIWHKQEKVKRLKEAEKLAENLLDKIDINDKSIQELALAMLYLGEGFKTNRELGIGNSDPLILKFFIDVYLKNFKVKKRSIKCELHLRADQNPEIIKQFWSKELNLPIENFRYVSIDKRTFGSISYPEYKGVCALRCGNVAAKRKLIYIAEKYCNKILEGRLAQG